MGDGGHELRIGPAGNGTLEITDGGTVYGQLIVGNQGEIRGDGNIVGNVANSGLVSPGTSPGALNIDGNYAQTSGGELLIELVSASSYDQLLVTGSATLAGTLEVSLIGGYAPLAGHSFDILDWGGTLTGTFATLNLPGLTGDLVWNTTALYTSGAISVVLLGDYNGNGTVDAADYVLWRDTLGQTGVFLAADGNGNDEIDPGDYDFWKLHFGETTGSGSAGASPSRAAVPEPNGAALALVALAGVAAVYRRRMSVEKSSRSA